MHEPLSRWRHLWPHRDNATAMESAAHDILSDYYRWHASLQTASPDPVSTGSVLLQRAIALLSDLSARLQRDSTPWPDPAYLAHMNGDVPIAASLAFFAALLYNPNNVTAETSLVTTELEHELSDDLCSLFDFDTRQGWAHLCSGGHAGNYEAMWMARNLKQIPFALAEAPACQTAMQQVATLELHNMAPAKVVQLLCSLEPAIRDSVMHEARTLPTTASSRERGAVYVAAHRHPAWDKCADLLGLQLVPVVVDSTRRMDTARLREQLLRAIGDGSPIVAVVATTGSSGEGSVDDIDAILALRQECQTRFGASFFIHADAAYGGYYRCLLRSQSGGPECDSNGNELAPEVAKALRALTHVDTITVDPHKSGYAPYPAGALVVRDRRYADAIAWRSRYFSETRGERRGFGAYTLEGARPGAAVAAVWTLHRLLGLHRQGLGALLADGVYLARRFHLALNEAATFPIEGVLHRFVSLAMPDLAMLNFAVLPVDENATDATNAARISELSERVIALAPGPEALPDTPWFSRNRVPVMHVLGQPVDSRTTTVIRCCFLKPYARDQADAFVLRLIDRLQQQLATRRDKITPPSS